MNSVTDHGNITGVSDRFPASPGKRRGDVGRVVMVHDEKPRRDREALSTDAWWEWSEVRGFVAVVVLALLGAVGLTGLVGLGTPPAGAAPTAVSAPQTGFVVNEEPAQTTPSIMDGTVNSVTQVGNQVIVGGSFTQVRNPSSSTTLTRNHLLAFDASTGVVSPTFNPAPDGVVHKVQAASDGTSVYVGGHFSNAGGRPARYLFRASAASRWPVVGVPAGPGRRRARPGSGGQPAVGGGQVLARRHACSAGARHAGRLERCLRRVLHRCHRGAPQPQPGLVADRRAPDLRQPGQHPARRGRQLHRPSTARPARRS